MKLFHVKHSAGGQKSACRLFLYNALRRSERCDGQRTNHQDKLEYEYKRNSDEMQENQALHEQNNYIIITIQRTSMKAAQRGMFHVKH